MEEILVLCRCSRKDINLNLKFVTKLCSFHCQFLVAVATQYLLQCVCVSQIFSSEAKLYSPNLCLGKSLIDHVVIWLHVVVSISNAFEEAQMQWYARQIYVLKGGVWVRWSYWPCCDLIYGPCCSCRGLVSPH